MTVYRRLSPETLSEKLTHIHSDGLWFLYLPPQTPSQAVCVHPSAATSVASVSQERIHGKFKPIWVTRIANGETLIEVES